MVNGIIRSAFTLLVVTFFYGCSLFSSKMTLINNGATELSQLKVYAAKELVWQGKLGVGQQITFNFYPDRDGSFDFKYRLKNRNVSHEQFGYTTNNDWSEFVVTITDEKLEFEQIFD